MTVELKDIDIYDLEVAETWEEIKNKAVSLEGEVAGLSAVASIRWLKKRRCKYIP